MATPPSPRIETERLILRPSTSADLEAWARLFADAEVVRYIPKSDLTPRERAERSIASYARMWQLDGTGAWVLTRKGENEMLGYSWVAYRADTDEYELGYGIARSAWGQGLVTEAARATVRFALDHASMERIMAVVVPENAASARVLAHLGFVYEKEAVYYDLAVAYYALRRDHFTLGDHAYRLSFTEPTEG
jgi:RimJ/RimL family protein N-acetyltransferase